MPVGAIESPRHVCPFSGAGVVDEPEQTPMGYSLQAANERQTAVGRNAGKDAPEKQSQCQRSEFPGNDCA